MTRLPPEKLAELSKDDLLALVERLFTELEYLQAEIERLKRPPPTSRNSSLPPSRDQKHDVPERKAKRSVGAKPGHPR